MSALSTHLVGCSQFESHPKQCRQCSKASRDFNWDLQAANRFCRASCQISMKNEFRLISPVLLLQKFTLLLCAGNPRGTRSVDLEYDDRIHFQRNNHSEKLVSANSASSLFYRIQSQRLVASKNDKAYLMISAYSLSFPLLSLHFLNMTDASTLAGENVLGSLSKEITLSKIVLKKVTTTSVRANTGFGCRQLL